ncbi:MAG TPA: NUDIX domain-containing protein [Pseudomonadota bacterium]|nr:NUDIX domain-containing protein [Pseudomonadota bacterium]HNK43520.1 NUDIX domain-containing protein [Pseudomonadota bacterium]HNN49653.1 NUDIX domain-containing protein [Pseudomonadota bacterium]
MPPSRTQVVEPLSPLPSAFSASLFVAGVPGPWTHVVVRTLEQAGWDGVVYLPTVNLSSVADSGKRSELVRWRDEALRHSDGVLIWLGDGGKDDPWLFELWGAWQRSSRVVLGVPRDQPVPDSASRLHIPIARSPVDAVEQALQMLRPGQQRRGGERTVPLLLWRSPGFAAWYQAQRKAGHRLEDAQLEWSYRSRAAGRPPLLWALRPRVFVVGERRHKSGEVVIGRTDVSASVLFSPAKSGNIFDAKVVLVREYRSAVRNRLGFGLMLPGGSAAMASERNTDPRQTAQREVAEETGLQIDPAQFEPVEAGDRQVAASLASYHCHLFRVTLRSDQLQALEATAASGKSNGANIGERCYVTVKTVRELLDSSDLDWSQLGMVLHALGVPPPT